MAKVTFENVSKFFSDVCVVNDLSFVINDREFVVIVGPSGCGKSTTLRMIAGLETISNGKVYIGDRIVNDIAPKDRDIAMVFQNYALYPHMTVYKNMSFGLTLRKVETAEIDRRVKSAAAILGIESYLDRKPKQLSGGQRQRVAVGRAIVRNPAVFLFDEPLSNLDAKLRVQMRSELKKLHQQLKATMVYVTHDQVEAMTMGDRIVILKDGILQQVGPPLEIYHRPVNQFVAGFIGSPSMNFIPGRVKMDSGRTFISSDAGDILLDDSFRENCAFENGQPVHLGIRPEDISLAGDPMPVNHVRITGNIDLVEAMGSETLAHFNAGSQHFIARMDGDSIVKTGDSVSLMFPQSKIHVFDAKTERTLRTG